MQVSGSAIDRVFNPPISPPRRFRGAIDAALTLALGSVCAFALTLGPAPLNTVAVSSAAAASFTGQFDPDAQVSLLPAEVDSDDRSGDQSDNESTPAPGATSDAVAQSPGESSTAKPPASTKNSQKAHPSQAKKPHGPQRPPHAQKPPKAKPHQNPPPPKKAQPHQKAQQPQSGQKSQKTAAPELSPSAALSVVQDYRVASGLAAFVSANECTQATFHASVTVTPSEALPPGQARKTLAPDPAFATVSGTSGALTVTVHACG